LMVILLTGVFFCFYRVLGAFNIGNAWLWTLLLLCAHPDFLFRMNLIRDPAPSLIVLLIGVYLLLKERPWGLAVMGFIYVWLYGGFIFLPLIALIYVVARGLDDGRIRWNLLAGSLGGIIAGMIINPYFPRHLGYMVVQIFKTGLGAGNMNVGGEWRPYDTWSFATGAAVTLILLLAGMVIPMLRRKRPSIQALSILAMSFLFLVLTLKSRRFIEYWPAFAVLAGAFLLDGELAGILPARWFGLSKLRFFWKRLAAAAGAALILFLVAQNNVESARADIRPYINVPDTRDAIRWVRDHSNPGDIVFTDDWDIFPPFFFYNSKNYYLVGLDPVFMDQFDHRLYEEFAAITRGEISDRLPERFKADFKARYVIIDNDHRRFRNHLADYADQLPLVYRNDTYLVFEVK